MPREAERTVQFPPGNLVVEQEDAWIHGRTLGHRPQKPLGMSSREEQRGRGKLTACQGLPGAPTAGGGQSPGGWGGEMNCVPQKKCGGPNPPVNVP